MNSPVPFPAYRMPSVRKLFAEHAKPMTAIEGDFYVCHQDAHFVLNLHSRGVVTLEQIFPRSQRFCLSGEQAEELVSAAAECVERAEQEAMRALPLAPKVGDRMYERSEGNDGEVRRVPASVKRVFYQTFQAGGRLWSKSTGRPVSRGEQGVQILRA